MENETINKIMRGAFSALFLSAAFLKFGPGPIISLIYLNLLKTHAPTWNRL